MQSLTSEQKTFFKSQLDYTHLDYLPPPSTRVINETQHEMIVDTVRSFATENRVHMLDVGCGWGDFSEKLDAYLKSYIGIEPSLSELQRFKLRPNRCVMRGVGEFLDFIKDQSRNFILLNSVMDHAFDCEKVFSNCLRILQPGGLLIIGMENSEKWPVRVRKWLGRSVVHKGHFSYWGMADIQRMLAAEFDILQKRSSGFLFGFDQFTSRVPLPLGLLRPLNRAMDKWCGLLDPNGGMMLFFAAIRKGKAAEPNNLDHPLCCPVCKADWEWGTPKCRACGCEFPSTAGWVDTLALNADLKQEAVPHK